MLIKYPLVADFFLEYLLLEFESELLALAPQGLGQHGVTAVEHSHLPLALLSDLGEHLDQGVNILQIVGSIVIKDIKKGVLIPENLVAYKSSQLCCFLFKTSIFIPNICVTLFSPALFQFGRPALVLDLRPVTRSRSSLL